MNHNIDWNLIVIGGGAAGFYAAIQTAELTPGINILILEKSGKVLSKVRVSGGGRCNVTQHNYNPKTLSQHYPRGKKRLAEWFKVYQSKHVVDWFKNKGVALKIEDDGRMFPITNTSQTIIDCFHEEIVKHNIKLCTHANVKALSKSVSGDWIVETESERYQSKNVLVAIGGSPKKDLYQFIERLGHKIINPLPSLFTFNDQHKSFSELMGVSINKATVRIEGTKFLQTGPILITHWGLSGPAVIKLSAWAAEYLFEKEYSCKILVNWIADFSQDKCRNLLGIMKQEKSKQKIIKKSAFDLPIRLWQKLCQLAEIDEEKVWGEVSKKNLNKLTELLTNTIFQMGGKTTFKEEFVTCGGIDLEEINGDTLESLKLPGLFFAGEVLNIDGETGGYNFQAAWTTAYLVARTIASKKIGDS